MYVSYYTPLTVQSATLDGSRSASSSRPSSARQVYSDFVSVPAGGTRTLVFHLEGSVPAGSTYHLEVLSQPLVHDDSVAVRIHSSSPAWHVASADGPGGRRRGGDAVGVDQHRPPVHGPLLPLTTRRPPTPNWF